jgi:UPF0271 protein
VDEVFADRTYQDDGSLTPRGRRDAMIEDIETAVLQIRRMITDGVVRSVTGTDVAVRAGTLCIHGDQPGASQFARRIRSELGQAGIDVRAPGDN